MLCQMPVLQPAENDDQRVREPEHTLGLPLRRRHSPSPPFGLVNEPNPLEYRPEEHDDRPCYVENVIQQAPQEAHREDEHNRTRTTETNEAGASTPPQVHHLVLPTLKSTSDSQEYAV